PVNVSAPCTVDQSGVAQKPAARGLPARDKRVYLYLLSLLFDCGSLLIGYFVALGFRDTAWLEAGDQPIIVLALPVFLMFEIAREVQSEETLESRSLGTQRALGALLATALIVLALTFLIKAEDISRVGFLITFGVAAALIVVGKLVLDIVFNRWMGGQATATIVVQDGLITRPHPGCDFIDVEALGLWPDLNAPASIDALSRIIAPYDRVVISCHFERRPAWATFLKSQDVGGEILLDRDLLHGAVAIGAYGDDDTLILSRGPLSLTSRMQKRAFDLVVSIAALIVFAPLMIVVAVLIKLESRGPVFFRQVRVGIGNRQFKILKFRSMRLETLDTDGAMSTQRDDPRITRVGRFIRRTSIDELPQLINVLVGEMSIVGPRPHALGSLAGEDLFWEVTQAYWIRHALKPGITGLAQIRGFRGSTDSREDLEHRVRADLEYVSTWSLAQDIVILLRTARVLVHKNAY
ncbi:MAG TPA: sugar transferase, partial [Croceibacterium sp.]|nr:sugar transferase [Croceibacterium sp.]